MATCTVQSEDWHVGALSTDAPQTFVSSPSLQATAEAYRDEEKKDADADSMPLHVSTDSSLAKEDTVRTASPTSVIESDYGDSVSSWIDQTCCHPFDALSSYLPSLVETESPWKRKPSKSLKGGNSQKNKKSKDVDPRPQGKSWTVQFSSDPEVHLPPKDYFSTFDRSDIWYSKEEFETIDQACKESVKSYMNQVVANSFDPNDSIRGLEGFTKVGTLSHIRFQLQIRESRRMVLDTQQKHKDDPEKGPVDPEELSRTYYCNCNNARAMALIKGREDAEDVKKLLLEERE